MPMKSNACCEPMSSDTPAVSCRPIKHTARALYYTDTVWFNMTVKHTNAAGNFCHLHLVSNTKSYQAFKAKDHPQGQGKDLDCKAKDKDFGLKD